MGVFQVFIEQSKGAVAAFGAANNFNAMMNAIAGLIWSPPFILLCFAVGIYLTIRLRLVQARKLNSMRKLLFVRSESSHGVSSFQAFALAVSGRVGTGDIVGVATAIAYGGPGALFWMWVYAFIGAASAFVESTLAQLYKEEIGDEYRGGPAFYLGKRGHKHLGTIIAVLVVFTGAICTPPLQANSIVTMVSGNFFAGKAHTFLGLTFTPGALISMCITIFLLILIVVGGTKSIAKAAETLVTFMSVAYIAAAIILLIVNAGLVPDMFKLIFKSAFGAEQTLGGIFGWAIMWGVRRAAISNEAGMGTAPHAAAAAEVKHPAKQGLVQAFSVYFDTLFVTTATALVILSTGVYQVFQMNGGQNAAGIFQTYPEHTSDYFVQNGMAGNEESVTMFTTGAFDTLMPNFGGKFVTICLFFFAFTTILAFYYYAETNLQLLLKNKGAKVRAIGVRILQAVFFAATFYFGLKGNAFVWDLAEIGIGAMAWLNIIALVLFAKPAIVCLKDYEERERLGTTEEWFVIDELPEAMQKLFKGVSFWRGSFDHIVHYDPANKKTS